MPAFSAATVSRKRLVREPVAEAAFTLLELMLAIAIFSGVVAAIYSTWTAILRSSQSALSAAAEAQRRRIAVSTVEEALASVQMFPDNTRYYAFVAETEDENASLSFVARLPRSFPRSGRFGDLLVRRLWFQVEPDAAGVSTLVLRQRPLLAVEDVDEEENPLVLARNVALFHLEFWGPRSREWEPDWPATNQLPRLVRFSLAFEEPGRQGVDPASVVTRVVDLPIQGIAIPAPGQRSAAIPGGPATNRSDVLRGRVRPPVNQPNIPQ